MISKFKMIESSSTYSIKNMVKPIAAQSGKNRKIFERNLNTSFKHMQ